MFCYQCQEAAAGTGCTAMGVCGKTSALANSQDLLLYTLKGIALFNKEARIHMLDTSEADEFIMEGLFTTITNANFDYDFFSKKISEALQLREKVKAKLIENGIEISDIKNDAAVWLTDKEKFDEKAKTVGVLKTKNEDIRSLRELIIYGVKGLAAYVEHAFNLGYKNAEIFVFIEKTLVSTLDDTLTLDELVALTIETGKFGVEAMALLD